jgi:hypothetical protein
MVNPSCGFMTPILPLRAADGRAISTGHLILAKRVDTVNHARPRSSVG